MISPYSYLLLIRGDKSDFDFFLDYFSVYRQNLIVAAFPEFFVVSDNDKLEPFFFVEREGRFIEGSVFLEIIRGTSIAFVMV